MQQSPAIAELMVALIAARKEFKAVHKSADNPFFKSKYADLSEIIGATHEALTKHGIVILQSPGSFDGKHSSLTTMISHTSGQWISDVFQMPVAKVDPQGIGSSTTYMRRYALQSFLNIAADLDDDAEAAVEHEKTEIRKPQALNKPTTRVFDAPPNPNDSFGEEKATFKAGLEMPANDPPRLPKPADNTPNQSPITSAYISDAQRKRMWAIAKDRGMEKSAVKNIYGRYGAEDDFHIPWKCYKDIMAQIETYTHAVTQ